MQQVERFGVSMPTDLLARLDEAIAEAGYKNRSEAIRDMVRDYLVRRQWDDSAEEVVGAVTISYDHHCPEVLCKLTSLQHHHGATVLCSTHIHLDHHHCLETVVVRGTGMQVRTLAEGLLSIRGVKHGGLTITAADGL